MSSLAWTDRTAHYLPSCEIIKRDVQLADLPFEASTSMQKDLQAALVRMIDIATLMAEENLKFYRAGNLSQETQRILNDRVTLYVALQNGRNR